MYREKAGRKASRAAEVTHTLFPLCLSGRMRGSLATLERLSQIFPEDISLKNDLGVAHLLLGDNKGAKKVYEEVRVCV